MKRQRGLRLLLIFTAIVLAERRYKKAPLCIIYVFQIDGKATGCMNKIYINQLAIYSLQAHPA